MRPPRALSSGSRSPTGGRLVDGPATRTGTVPPPPRDGHACAARLVNTQRDLSSHVATCRAIFVPGGNSRPNRQPEGQPDDSSSPIPNRPPDRHDPRREDRHVPHRPDGRRPADPAARRHARRSRRDPQPAVRDAPGRPDDPSEGLAVRARLDRRPGPATDQPAQLRVAVAQLHRDVDDREPAAGRARRLRAGRLPRRPRPPARQPDRPAPVDRDGRPGPQAAVGRPERRRAQAPHRAQSDPAGPGSEGPAREGPAADRRRRAADPGRARRPARSRGVQAGRHDRHALGRSLRPALAGRRPDPLGS